MNEIPPSSTNILPSQHRSLKDRGVDLYKQVESYTPAAFFLGGFVLDLATLGRIDDWSNWLMQVLYIVAAGGLLLWIFLDPEDPPPDSAGKVKKLIYEYRTEAMHFCFGALLSVYTIFYFKSSSLIVSFFFILLLTGLLLANEFQKFKSQGYFLKFALFALCIISFLIYFVPILLGHVGTLAFLLSFALSVAFFYWVFQFLKKRTPDSQLLMTQVFRPVAFVLILFLVLYLLRVLPPVPLSLKYVGVYHNIEKTPEGYKLQYDRPFWKFWQHGSQDFIADPGSKLYVFFQLFSPSAFSDQIYLEWYLKVPKQGWMLQDRIPIPVKGGRDEGYRGYGQKSNYTDGDWRVKVVTSDFREVGRIQFSVKKIASLPEARDWQYDIH
ncbi:MAG: DUF2914 domain-containing protein [Bdellovibrionales bacterium]|nr:DUF2914 domain-containing protein [Bdellovibrionales bacterium]